ncbi:uncharacterized protein LOC135935971 [Cloeon dipterum]|uniref:uncharacterized protein LOC135935971 n=1 Tax=Cloeon dipterum TaxID=197152 RepID=UPI00321FACF7
MSSLKDQVYPGDVIAAIKTIFGSEANVVDFEVSKGTSSVQGFMSCILRVRATCTVGNDSETKTAQFIVKSMPTLEAQKAVVQDMRLFDQEIAFFTKCLPTMKKRCPDLKVVNCLFAHSASTIVMEDLSQNGFTTLMKNFEDTKDQLLTFGQARMAIRELAKLHASSQGTDWLKIMPEFFEKDILLEVDDGKSCKQMVCNSIRGSVIPILEHIYRDETSKIQKYVDWIRDFEGNVFPFILKVNKANPRYQNALCHGDFGVHNFMVRSHPDSGDEIKIIDLQTVHFAPVHSDLLYFFYLGLKGDFRVQHEEALLRTYVEQFNASCNHTPDPIDLDQFIMDYDENRLFGILMAISMCPIPFVGGISPPEGAELTEENFNNLLGSEEQLDRNKFIALKTLNENHHFQSEMKFLIDEMISELDKTVFKK